MERHISSRAATQVAINRRLVASSLLFSLCPLPGCSASYPKRGLTGLQSKRIRYAEPRYEPNLKVNVSAGAFMASAANVRDAQARINGALRSWTDPVVGQFSNALIGTLAARGFDIEAIPKDTGSTASQSVGYAASIRSYLTAGFVYRTYTSVAYAPFVQVVLEVRSPDGLAFYHQLYVATDRPFNLFMNSLPAATPYLLEDIDSLQSTSEEALKAFALLAAQLGQKFATDLLASAA